MENQANQAAKVAANSTKVLDLATAELGKDEVAKAMDALVSAVEDNKLEFVNAIHLHKKKVKEAKTVLDAQSKTPNVTPNNLVESKLTVIALEKELQLLEEIFNERF